MLILDHVLYVYIINIQHVKNVYGSYPIMLILISNNIYMKH